MTPCIYGGRNHSCSWSSEADKGLMQAAVCTKSPTNSNTQSRHPGLDALARLENCQCSRDPTLCAPVKQSTVFWSHALKCCCQTCFSTHAVRNSFIGGASSRGSLVRPAPSQPAKASQCLVSSCTAQDAACRSS